VLTSDSQEAMIEVRDLKKSYGDVAAVKGVTFSVEQGKAHVLIGASGCGKSTVLRCINLLEEPTSGSLRVGDEGINFGPGGTIMSARQIAKFRSEVGMVFQQYYLFPHMTALQNVMSGPVIVKKAARRDAEELAQSLLKKVGLADKAQQYPRELSGGQAQRVAIARALAMQPKVMLFDEVTSALDPVLVGEVLDVMKELAFEGTTMIVVTHEMAFAREVADRVCFMDEGVVIEEGHPKEVLAHPRTPKLQNFIRRLDR
jgi:ABC-type polar amino acid transport system ATPase subunit